MIYDEAMEVNVDGYSFLAFHKFESLACLGRFGALWRVPGSDTSLLRNQVPKSKRGMVFWPEMFKPLIGTVAAHLRLVRAHFALLGVLGFGGLLSRRILFTP